MIISNRQKKLQLQQALQRDPNKYANQTIFRKVERQYKQRVPAPDFNTLIDISNLSKLPSEYENLLYEIPLSFELYNQDELFKTSKEEGLIQAYGIKGKEGFLIIRNPFKIEKERQLLLDLMEQYTKPPYVSNLDTHYIIPEDGVYKRYKEYFNKNEEEPKENWLKLKLDPKNIKDKQEAQPIETSSATEGYQYNGLNDKDELIKNTNLKCLPNKELIRRMRWITFGYQYHWPTKLYKYNESSPVPEPLARLSQLIVKAVQGVNYLNANNEPIMLNYNKKYCPEGGVLNFYQLKDSLMGHVDRSEPNTEAPLVSFSFGNSAVFLLGGITKDIPPIPIRLNSGDIMILNGPTRLAFHSVPRIIEDSLPTYLKKDTLLNDMKEQDWLPLYNYLEGTRINANIRQVMNYED